MSLVQSQRQRQILNQRMAQSLTVLQMPLTELYRYLSEQAVQNPLLDVDMPEILSVELPRSAEPEDVIWRSDDADFIPEHARRKTDGETRAEPVDRGERFTELLRRQLFEERRIPKDLLPLCLFLVDSLNRRGYLDDPIELLAEVAEARVEDMTQALYILQEMSPAGVGARSLQECLILQLVQTQDFSAETVKLIKDGLDLLAANDIRAVARLLNVGKDEALRCCAAIRRLNPIPSRGYDTLDDAAFVIPEAEVSRENGRWTVRYHDSALPRVSVNREYREMLERTDDPQLSDYLREHLTAAKHVTRELEARKRTVLRVLECLVERQSAFFTQGFAALSPLTISEMADELGLHPSTVSRAVQGKYLMTPAGPVELRRLFSAHASPDGAVSTAGAKERLNALIAAEDRAHPLSDEKLCQAMQALGIPLSRRTVAKYREAMGIPAAAKRRDSAKSQAMSSDRICG